MHPLKLLILLFALYPLVLIAQSNVENRIIISGQVDNSTRDTLNIASWNSELSKAVIISDDGKFSASLGWPSGVYNLIYGDEYLTTYLAEGFKIELNFTHGKLQESIEVSGKGAETVRYYLEKNQQEQDLFDLTYYGNILKLDEAPFLHRIDSLKAVKDQLLERHEQGLDPSFIFLESNNIKYWRLLEIANYQGGRRWLTEDKEYNVSSEFPLLYPAMDLENEALVNSPFYIGYVKSYLVSKANEAVKQDSLLKWDLELLDVTKQEIENPKVLNKLFTDYLKSEGRRTEHVSEFFTRLESGITDEEQLLELAALKAQRLKTAPGTSVPNFSLENEKGDSIVLNQYRGNLIVIDVWASWCMPCLKELPKFKSMKEKYKDAPVVFISINSMDSKDRWLKCLEDNEMSGIQLFAPDSEIPFFKDLMIYSMPRFILIDKDGRLIKSRLDRPSSPLFEVTLDAALNEE